ncbi:hypothetical protein EMIT079MI2_180079 [Bacillus sp. IT-79MI2]
MIGNLGVFLYAIMYKNTLYEIEEYICSNVEGPIKILKIN